MRYTVIGGALLAASLSIMAGSMAVGQQNAEEEEFEQSEEATEKIGAVFNPADINRDTGLELFRAPGPNGKSCASCHGDDGKDLIGAATHYPKVISREEGVRNMELQINICRTERMDAKPYEGSAPPFTEMRDMLVFINSLSNGMPINVKTDGIAHEFWEKGKQYFWTRRGQRNLSCGNCHVMNGNRRLGPVRLHISRDQATKFPVYTLATETVETLQFRYQTCSWDVRAKALDINSSTLLSLELYHTSLSNGMPFRVPGFSL